MATRARRRRPSRRRSMPIQRRFGCSWAATLSPRFVCMRRRCSRISLVGNAWRPKPASHPELAIDAGEIDMSDNLELAGLRALVTGGTQRMGAAFVMRLVYARSIVLTTARNRAALTAQGML